MLIVCRSAGERWTLWQRTARIAPIAELVLLRVGITEDVKAKQLDEQHARHARHTDPHGVDRKVLRLQAVDERHPRKVADAEHEAKPVGSDVHLRERHSLIVNRIKRVPGVEDQHKHHALGDLTKAHVLLAHAADVDQSPQD